MGLGQRLGPRLRRQPLACESTGTIQALPYILMRSLKTCGARRGKGYVRHTRGWHTCSGAHELPGKGGWGGGESCPAPQVRTARRRPARARAAQPAQRVNLVEDGRLRRKRARVRFVKLEAVPSED